MHKGTRTPRFTCAHWRTHRQFESLSALKKQVAELFEVSKRKEMNKEGGNRGKGKERIRREM